MAFEWDDVQGRFIERKLSGHAARFELKVTVAGSALEIDAVAEEPESVGFFDFFTRLTLLENKAPSVTLSEEDVCHSAGRAFLFAAKQQNALDTADEITQVFLCSRASAAVLEKLEWREIRAGVLEAHKGIRLVLVLAGKLEIGEETLELLVHYAAEPKLREVIEYIVDYEVERLYTLVWILHREVFKEVLAMKGKSAEGLVIDVAGAIEELGLGKVIADVGLGRVIAEVGLDKVIAEVGLKRVLEEVGLERLVEEAGPEKIRQVLERLERKKD